VFDRPRLRFGLLLMLPACRSAAKRATFIDNFCNVSTNDPCQKYDARMTSPNRPRRSAPSTSRNPETLLAARPLDLSQAGNVPRIQVKSPTSHPFLYRKRIGEIPSGVRDGDLVQVTYGSNEVLGYGLYNSKAEMTVRMLSLGPDAIDSEFWDRLLDRAVRLRRDLLRLDADTDTYRVIHAEGDGFSGLVVDRYGDTLSAEAYSLGMYQRLEAILERLAKQCGTKHWRIRTAPQVHGQEGFVGPEPTTSPDAPDRVTVQEFGTRFRVEFAGGHKTGFFCDQRDNRRRLAQFCRDRSVLDICCYTGGFAIQAKKLGQAREVTAIDLDEVPLELAKENANLNQARINFVHADAYSYMRDMVRNGKKYEVVILDPPKLIRNRRELEEGTRAHFDLNRLAMQLVEPGGLLLTCSCSGLLDEPTFLRLLHSAAQKAVPQGTETDLLRPGRTLQILEKTGAAADHPVTTTCPETEYLRAIWLRVL
jgi:23S rRNA (cytosine1962-C5)-methyltransferase